MNEKLIALAIFLDIINEEDWDFNQDPPVFINFEGHEQVITEDWDFSTCPPTYIKELEEDEEPLSWEDMGVPLWDELDLPEESNDCIFDYGKYWYLVCTDDEADERWEEQLDNYIEECIMPEIPEPYRYYFDEELWKKDARYDGRGHSLSFYDGEENDQEFNGTYYYIYKN